jgi:hypothetical protein
MMLDPSGSFGAAARALPSTFSFLGLVLFAFGARGCAAHPGVERLANGDLYVACPGPLAPCLVPVADRCAENGFDVLQASERRETTGSPPESQQFVHSQATVRCRLPVPVIGRDPNQRLAPPVASAAPAGPPRCVPGLSQACGTQSGCTGAQLCAADGTHFGPCECAPPPAAASSAAPSAASD